MAFDRQAKNIPSRNIFSSCSRSLAELLFWWQSSYRQNELGRNRRDQLELICDVLESCRVFTLSHSFIPYEKVTMDEQLMGFRSHSSFRQYYEIKVRHQVVGTVHFNTSLSLNIISRVYISKRESTKPEKNQWERVVPDMIEVITGSGRNVTMNNFFTSCTRNMTVNNFFTSCSMHKDAQTSNCEDKKSEIILITILHRVT